MHRVLAGIALALGLAPGLVAAQTAMTLDEADACGASGMQRFVGNPEKALHRMKFAQPVAVVHPGSAPPANLLPIRMLVYVDDAGIITRITCG